MHLIAAQRPRCGRHDPARNAGRPRRCGTRGPGRGDHRRHPRHRARSGRRSSPRNGDRHPEPGDRPADDGGDGVVRDVRAYAVAARHLRSDGRAVCGRVRDRADRGRGTAGGGGARPGRRAADRGGRDGDRRQRGAGGDRCHGRDPLAAHPGGRGRCAAEQRPQFPEPGPAHPWSVDLAGAGRRRAEHQRPARHLQQLHR